MRVHDVVVTRLVGRFGPQHPGRESAQLGGQIVFVQTLERPRHHIAHQHTGGDPLDGRIGGRGGPGEDLYLDAPLGQVQRTLQHIDVHTPGIAGARLGKWRGVHCQHRNPARVVRCGNAPIPAPF